MLEGRASGNDLKKSLETAKEVIRDRQKTNPSETYYLSFSLQLASPRRSSTSSQILSDMEKLQNILTKYGADEEFMVKILFGVANPVHDDFIAEVVKRDQAAAALKLPKPELVKP